jgi:hypothetical protein
LLLPARTCMTALQEYQSAKENSRKKMVLPG